ncbi:MAG: MBL fold metallo-hydrolase [Rhodospirillaceae bacterium]
MRCFKLFSAGDHRWLAFGQDHERPTSIVDTNQVVVCSGRTTMILDPGGIEIFPMVMGALVHQIDMETVQHIFMSHQDQDVASALSLWRQVTPASVSIHLPALWTSYIAHFDADAKFVPIPDEGVDMRLGSVQLRFLPAHYLHSSAAFCVYDPAARLLFSGDIGAAELPEGTRRDIWVADFADHVAAMTGFHRRYLGSPAARDAWVEMISRLDVDMIVPQHGLAFRGDDVRRFLDWLSGLAIGTGIEAYRSRAALIQRESRHG